MPKRLFSSCSKCLSFFVFLLPFLPSSSLCCCSFFVVFFFILLASSSFFLLLASSSSFYFILLDSTSFFLLLLQFSSFVFVLHIILKKEATNRERTSPFIHSCIPNDNMLMYLVVRTCTFRIQCDRCTIATSKACLSD